MPIKSFVMSNPKADRVAKVTELLQRKVRERTGKFIVEGPQSVGELLTWYPQVVTDLYVSVESAEEDAPFSSTTIAKLAGKAMHEDVYIHKCTRDVVDRMSKDAQGVVAVGDMERCQELIGSLPETPRPFIAAFWQVRDPGNAGTVIRSADAAGCDAVVLVGDCVDVFNPKVIRATTGSLFHLPVVRMAEEDFYEWCGLRQLPVIAADVYGTEEREPEPLPQYLESEQARNNGKVVLFGNEARGLNEAMLGQAHSIVAIPIYGKAESLNLATSASVMLMSMAMSSHIETI